MPRLPTAVWLRAPAPVGWQVGEQCPALPLPPPLLCPTPYWTSLRDPET